MESKSLARASFAYLSTLLPTVETVPVVFELWLEFLSRNLSAFRLEFLSSLNEDEREFTEHAVQRLSETIQQLSKTIQIPSENTLPTFSEHLTILGLDARSKAEEQRIAAEDYRLILMDLIGTRAEAEFTARVFASTVSASFLEAIRTALTGTVKLEKSFREYQEAVNCVRDTISDDPSGYRSDSRYRPARRNRDELTDKFRAKFSFTLGTLLSCVAHAKANAFIGNNYPERLGHEVVLLLSVQYLRALEDQLVFSLVIELFQRDEDKVQQIFDWQS